MHTVYTHIHACSHTYTHSMYTQAYNHVYLHSITLNFIKWSIPISPYIRCTAPERVHSYNSNRSYHTETDINCNTFPCYICYKASIQKENSNSVSELLSWITGLVTKDGSNPADHRSVVISRNHISVGR